MIHKHIIQSSGKTYFLLEAAQTFWGEKKNIIEEVTLSSALVKGLHTRQIKETETAMWTRCMKEIPRNEKGVQARVSAWDSLDLEHDNEA